MAAAVDKKALHDVYNTPHVPPGMKSVLNDGPDQWTVAMRVLGWGVLLTVCLVVAASLVGIVGLYAVAAGVFVAALVGAGVLLNAASKVYIPQGAAGITLRRNNAGEFEPIHELLKWGMHRRWPGRHRRVFTYGLESGDLAIDVKLEFADGLKFNVPLKVQVHAPETLAEAIQNFTARWKIYTTEGKDHATALKEVIGKFAKAKIETLGLDLIRNPSGPMGGEARLLNELRADADFVTALDAIDGQLTKLSFDLKEEHAKAIYGQEPFISSKDRPMLVAVHDAQSLGQDTRGLISEVKAYIKMCEALIAPGALVLDASKKLVDRSVQAVNETNGLLSAGQKIGAGNRRAIRDAGIAIEAVKHLANNLAAISPAGLDQAALDRLNDGLNELVSKFDQSVAAINVLTVNTDDLEKFEAQVVEAHGKAADLRDAVVEAHGKAADVFDELAAALKRANDAKRTLVDTEGNLAAAMAQVYNLTKPRDPNSGGKKK